MNFKQLARGLIAEAYMGKQTEDFLKSEIGRYLLGRARQEAAMAMGELKSVSPWRRRRIRQLQDRIAWAESFEAWLREMVATGKTAAKSFDRLMAESEDPAELQEELLHGEPEHEPT